VQGPDIGSYFGPISSSSQSEIYFLKVPFNIISPYAHNTNHEFGELHKDPNISADIKKQIFEWIGHVERMYQGRRAKKMSETTEEGSRRKGRLRLSWLEESEKDLREMKAMIWR
jgi:hypothetical protein